MNAMSERDAIIGTIDPVTLADTEVFTDVIDMSKFDRVMCIFACGSMNGSTGSLVARVVTCDSAGNNVTALKTASTIAAGSASAAQVIIEVDNNDLAGGSSALYKDRYIKFGMISGSTGGPATAIALGKSKYGPSTDDDLASVAEIELDVD
jgi:hypothetical protein